MFEVTADEYGRPSMCALLGATRESCYCALHRPSLGEVLTYGLLEFVVGEVVFCYQQDGMRGGLEIGGEVGGVFIDVDECEG